jgi:hypothetical protein
MAGEVAIDSGEKRLNELGYKQELRREMVRFFSFTTAPSFFLSLCFSSGFQFENDRGGL